MKLIHRRERNFDEGFLRAVTRGGRPAYLPFYEHVANPKFIARRMGVPFDKMPPSDPAYWRTYVDFWLGLGFDCIPMELRPAYPLGKGESHAGARGHGSEAYVIIRDEASFESYRWPSEGQVIELRHFETVASLLPAGVKIVGGVMAGPFEWAGYILGVMGMSYLIADNEPLVGRVFERIGRLHLSVLRQVAAMEAVGALRQGDDLGFKTSTFLPPPLLRKWVFPIYREMAGIAHAAGKPFVLHSCGDLSAVYDDLIDCGIDGKHSFEDVIMPVAQFKQRYGERMTPLGGLDVDVICRAEPDDLRAYTRRAVEQCFADGHWALGTGNSLADHLPEDRYLLVLEEGLRACGERA